MADEEKKGKSPDFTSDDELLVDAPELEEEEGEEPSELTPTPPTTPPPPAYASRAVAWLLAAGLAITAAIAVYGLFRPDIIPLTNQVSKIASAQEALASLVKAVENTAANTDAALFGGGYVSTAGDTLPSVSAQLRTLNATKEVFGREIGYARAIADSATRVAGRNSGLITKMKAENENISRQLVRAIALARGEVDSAGLSHASAVYSTATAARTRAFADSVFAESAKNAPRAREISRLASRLNARGDSALVRHAAFRAVADAAVANRSLLDSLAAINRAVFGDGTSSPKISSEYAAGVRAARKAAEKYRRK